MTKTINVIKSWILARSCDGFFDFTYKLSEIDDLSAVRDELVRGGYQVGLRFKGEDMLYISWGRKEYFKDRWIDNLNEYLKISSK